MYIFRHWQADFRKCIPSINSKQKLFFSPFVNLYHLIDLMFLKDLCKWQHLSPYKNKPPVMEIRRNIFSFFSHSFLRCSLRCPAFERANVSSETASLCLSISCVTPCSSVKWLVRVWIQFMTIHHLWQVHTVIYFKQQGTADDAWQKMVYCGHTYGCAYW